GQSKRMKSKLSKMIHPLCGKPVIAHVYKVASELNPKTMAIVVGFQRDQIMDALAEHSAEFLVQAEQLGTAHAVGVFLHHFPQVEGKLLVMNGDAPLLRKSVLEGMLMAHEQQKAQLSLLTADVVDPTGYGRIVRDGRGLLERIVEEADATEAERALNEINAGIYVFDLARLRQWLPQVQNANRQHEYYLPDVLAVALANKSTILALKADANDVAGINTRAELAAASRTMRSR